MAEDMTTTKRSIFTTRNGLILVAVLVAVFFAVMLLRSRIPFLGGLVKQTPLEETYVGLENLWAQGILNDPSKLGAFSTLSIGGIGTLVVKLLEMKKAGEDKASAMEASHLQDLSNLEGSWRQKLGDLQTNYDQVLNGKNAAESQVRDLKGQLGTYETSLTAQADKIRTFQVQAQSSKELLDSQGRSLQGALDENGRLTKTIDSIKRTSADVLTKETTLHRNELSALEAAKNKTIEDLQIKLGAEQQKNKVLADKNTRLNSIYVRANKLVAG